MKQFLIVLASIIVMPLYSQLNKVDYILQAKTESCHQTTLEDESSKLYLKVEYGSSKIENPTSLQTLKGKTIEKVELVYTSFTEDPSFNQQKLNKERLISLKKAIPSLVNDDLIEWKLISQTACTSSVQGKDFFHGFIITYRETPTPESMKKEMSFIEDILLGKSSTSKAVEESSLTDLRDGMTMDVGLDMHSTNLDKVPQFGNSAVEINTYLSKETVYPAELKRKQIEGKSYITATITEDGSVKNLRIGKSMHKEFDDEIFRVVSNMPKWKPASYKGDPVESMIKLSIVFSLSKNIYCDTIHTMPSYSFVEQSYLPDSTVFSILSRNKKWKNMIVACDFTGSMSPYTSQLLVWHQLKLKANDNRIKHFTFFNDGNATPDHLKRTGATGGIYHSEVTTFDDVKSLAMQTMMAGGGGDCPENNLEAVLEAIERNPTCDQVIMISDNYATPRDMELLEKIKKPICVIVCGSNGGVNTAYLDIARKTKGSIHTMESDIDNLVNLNEGETIEINHQFYQIQKGKFVRIYKM